MGPRKALLKIIKSINQKSNMVGTYTIGSDGSVAKENEQNHTLILHAEPLPIEQPCPGEQYTTPCNFQSSSNEPQSSTRTYTAVKPSTFSRFGTVEQTLRNHPQGKPIIKAANSSFSEEDRRALIRIVVAELVKAHNNSCYPPEQAKLALAQAIVDEFPRLKNKNFAKGYEHYYNNNSKNRGFIEYRLLTLRKPLSPSKKKYTKAACKKEHSKLELSKCSKLNPLTDAEIDERISSLQCKNPTETNKKIITLYLRDTRPHRRQWIESKNPTITEIFNTYPRLLDFGGEMINLEFEDMFPEQADHFLAKFPAFYKPRILAYAKKYRPALNKVSRIIKDENLRALLILVELLPVSNALKNSKGKEKARGQGKGKGKGKKRAVTEKEDEESNAPLKLEFPNKFLLRLVPEGTNLDQFVNRVRYDKAENVQPYLITVAGQQSRESSFIQGDGWFIEVNDNGNPIVGCDLLYKSMYVLNVAYPESLRNFYNFLDCYVYGISNQPNSLVSSIHINISNVELHGSDSDSAFDD